MLTVVSAAVLAAISNTACGADMTFALVSVSDKVFAEQKTASEVSCNILTASEPIETVAAFKLDAEALAGAECP